MADGGWRAGFIPHAALRAPRFSEPRLQVLLETFLRLQVFRDDDDGSLRKKFLQQRGQERLCGWTDAGTRQRSAMLQSPGKGLHGGSSRGGGEPIACRWAG